MTDYNEILDLIDENLPDNHQQKITAAKLREVFDELTEGVSSDVTDLNNNKQDTLQRYHENGAGYDVDIAGTQGNLYLNSSYTSLDYGSNTSYIMLDGDGINAYTAGNRQFTHNGVRIADANDLAGKQDTLTFDNTPTNGSDNPVKSNGIYDALQTKQDTLQRYEENTGGYDVNLKGTQSNIYIKQSDISMNYGSGTTEVKLNGDGVNLKTTGNGKATYNNDEIATVTDLTTKQDVLTFDTIPTNGSTNPVTSSGIYNAIHTWADKNKMKIWHMGSETNPNLSSYTWSLLIEGITDTDETFFVLEGTDANDSDMKVYYHIKAVYKHPVSGDIVSVVFERLENNVYKDLSLTEGTNDSITITANGSGVNVNNTNIYDYTYSKTVLDNHFADKQDELVSTQNIKSINNMSILGSGNLQISTEQEQADWDENDSTSLAYIQNKPDLSIYAEIADIDVQNEIITNSLYDLNTRIENIPAQVQSNWTESDSTSLAYIQNKPTITTPEQADWDENDSTSLAYIQNKPDLSVYAESADLATVATTGDYDDLTNKPDLTTKQDTLVSGTNIKTINSYSLLGSGNIEIQGGGVTFDAIPTENSYNAAYSGGIYKVITDNERTISNSLNGLRSDILTKQDELISGTNIKTINNNSLLGSGNISISFTQTKANWNETNSSSNAYIQNKPSGIVTSSTEGIKIEVVSALPASPVANTIYIVQEA